MFSHLVLFIPTALPTDLFLWDCINSPTLVKASMSCWHVMKPQGHFLMLSYKLVSDTQTFPETHNADTVGLLQNTAVLLFFFNWHVSFFFLSAITFALCLF